MRRIVIAIASTISGLVLLFSYHTSTNQSLVSAAGSLPLAPLPTNKSSSSDSSSSDSSSSGSSSSSTSSDPSSSSAPSTSNGQGGGGVSGTFTGGAADTAYGPVQVQISVSGGKITSVQILQVPQESSHDVRINSQAVPILNQEAVQAQSAQIDSVSGATYTSQGYTQSLQSAIDAAHLG
jgi:uncharacterized protein with FMN-binding domain